MCVTRLIQTAETELYFYLPSNIPLLGSAVVAVVTAGHNTQLVMVGSVGGWWCWCCLGVGAPYLLSALMTLTTTRQSQSPPQTPASHLMSHLKQTPDCRKYL